VTASYTIPQSTSGEFRFRSKPVDAKSIWAIIPTHQDWDGLRVTIQSLLNLKTPPKRIIVANDNKSAGHPTWLKDYPTVEVVDCKGNRGPATARNLGLGLTGEIPVEKSLGVFADLAKSGVGRLPEYMHNGYCRYLKTPDFPLSPTEFRWECDVDWFYFTDCGCEHDPDLFMHFEQAWKECGDCCAGISGPVVGKGDGPINAYMTEQGVLNPPLERTVHGVFLPQAIVTANALVCGIPFAFSGGFDPSFTEAAGEDLDLGLRMRRFGVIAWAREAQVSHRFEEDESDFCNRFRRYGRGNRRLEMKHNLPSLRARPFKTELPRHQRLADLAVSAMQAGYDEVIDESDRGVLKIVDPV